jgi:hypothetical protein
VKPQLDRAGAGERSVGVPAGDESPLDGARVRRSPVTASRSRPAGEITFSLGALGPNLWYMPAHLLQAMPMLVLGLLALAAIAARWAARRRSGSEQPGSEQARAASLDLAVGLALAAS